MSTVKLHSAVYGESGPDVLVLHGLFGMGDNWATLARRWSSTKGWRVHTLDLRNHGQSPRSLEHNYSVMAADVRQYIDDHGLLLQGKRPHWIGHSMGGKVAMFGACLYPEAIASLVVVDMAPREYPPHHQVIFDAIGSIDFSIHTSRQAVETALTPLIPHLGVRQFLAKNIGRPTPDTLDWKFHWAVLKKEYAEITVPLPAQAQSAVPALFVRGALSGYIEDSDWENIQDHFPAAKLVTIANAGHWVHAEQPEAFASAIEQFIQ